MTNFIVSDSFSSAYSIESFLPVVVIVDVSRINYPFFVIGKVSAEIKRIVGVSQM